MISCKLTRDELERLYQKRTALQLAKLMDCKVQEVRKVLGQHGIRKHQRVTVRHLNYIKARWMEMSDQDIARILRLKVLTVTYYRQEVLGLMKDRHGRAIGVPSRQQRLFN